MARGAAVYNAQLRNPNLVNAAMEAALESCEIGTPANEMQILALVLSPLLKEILCGRNSQGNQQQNARPGKSAGGIPEEEATQPVEWIPCHQFPLHGRAHDQPGPRNNVPTAVRTAASIKNQVIIQNESGLELIQPRNPF